MSGKLYIVGTPIGNMKDITYRAVETLKEVDLIATEDTRRTLGLLNVYGISKPLVSYYKHKENEGSEKIIAELISGKSVALVTDAGMPGVSDPGAVLVNKAREADIDINVVPGPTAVASAYALAGITDAVGFAFCAFLPEKQKDRDALTDNLKTLKLPLAFYVAPHDLEKTLKYLSSRLGDRKVWVCKELTKIYETVYVGTLNDVVIENPKGEFVVIIDGAKDEIPEEADVESLLRENISKGMSKSEAVKAVAKLLNVPKNSVYEASLKL